ncbi:MAG TPA: hypothetical protein VFC16_06180, partial [Nakamurella sp.]|nr:hypothetical protein [Nakamurella sp.]
TRTINNANIRTVNDGPHSPSPCGAPELKWARAGRADLSAIDSASARRRFALGCLRAAPVQPGTIRVLGGAGVVAAVLALALVWAAAIEDAGVRTEAVGLVLVLTACALLGLRAGYSGRSPTARPPGSFVTVAMRSSAAACCCSSAPSG